MIPEMTDPLGEHWRQPDDIRSAPMDATNVILSERQLSQLAEYSASYPSGVYPGKCWKREDRLGLMLVWYGDEDDGQCPIHWRSILIVD